MDSDHAFLDKFAHDFEKINHALEKNLGARVPLIEDIGRHSLLGQGKRLRPLLFLLCSRLCGSRRGDLYHFSTVFEYIHTGSLLHDDVLDNAETRRKKPSARNIWGNSAAVLIGDFLAIRSFGLALGSGDMEFLETLADATNQMTEGQVLELVNTHNWKISKAEYIKIITWKTAALISAACACGAIMAGAEDRFVRQLSEFGRSLGVAFQLIDDLLDYTSSEKDVGKPVGNDLKEGKVTLPLIYALAELETGQIERLQDLFKSREIEGAEYRGLIEMVRKNGIVDRIRVEARHYVDKAVSFLDPFPESPAKEDLLSLSAYLFERNF